LNSFQKVNQIKLLTEGLGEVAQVYNPSYSGGGDWEDSRSRSAWTKKRSRLYLNQQAKCSVLCWKHRQEDHSLRLAPGRNMKNNESRKGLGVMFQVVEYLPSKYEAWVQAPELKKKKKLTPKTTQVKSSF
jgi:hypothetical protein